MTCPDPGSTGTLVGPVGVTFVAPPAAIAPAAGSVCGALGWVPCGGPRLRRGRQCQQPQPQLRSRLQHLELHNRAGQCGHWQQQGQRLPANCHLRCAVGAQAQYFSFKLLAHLQGKPRQRRRPSQSNHLWKVRGYRHAVQPCRTMRRTSLAPRYHPTIPLFWERACAETSRCERRYTPWSLACRERSPRKSSACRCPQCGKHLPFQGGDRMSSSSGQRST